MKKALSVLLSIVLVISLIAIPISVPAFADSASENAKLEFNSDGSFRIMNFSDFQDMPVLSGLTTYFLKNSLKKYDPDLVILSGDNIRGSACLTQKSTELAIDCFMRIFEEYEIPVAIVFGNHDDQGKLSKEEQMEIYEKYDCFVGCDGEVTGCGNYNLPIYSSDGTKVIYNIWLFDSLTYNSEDTGYKENDLGGYACVQDDQINWYKSVSEELERANGKKIPSMAFQHIVVPEIYYEYEADGVTVKGSGALAKNEKGKWQLPAGAKGSLGENPCPPYYTNGQLDAMIDRKDVVAMFFGHDHTNTYEIKYRGIDLINTPTSGFALFTSYGNDSRGVRIIDLNENDLASNSEAYETRVVTWLDEIGRVNLCDIAEFIWKFDFSVHDFVKLLVNLRRPLEYLITNIGITFSEV